MTAQPTTQRNQTITGSTVMTLVAESAEFAVAAELSYASSDPFAVRVIFSIPGSQAVEWVFARDLLLGGLVGPMGHGDVQVFPMNDALAIELVSPGGRARLLADRDQVAEFVQRTLDVVPVGFEHRFFDLDQEIALVTGYPLAS